MILTVQLLSVILLLSMLEQSKSTLHLSATNNTIIARQGNASLWGGYANADDGIILSDDSLDQIIETSITADSVSIRFNDGGSLQIQGTANIIYQLADDSKYSASHERLEWDYR